MIVCLCITVENVAHTCTYLCAHCPFAGCVFKCLIMHFASLWDVHHSSQTANKVTREMKAPK